MSTCLSADGDTQQEVGSSPDRDAWASRAEHAREGARKIRLESVQNGRHPEGGRV